MLNNRRLTIIADSVPYDSETTEAQDKIASFGAVLDLDTMDVSFTSRYINKEACKANRDMVRIDQADFENYVYDLQDKMKG